MSDATTSALILNDPGASPEEPVDGLVTPEFQVALTDAEILLTYAAESVGLSDGVPADLVRDIVSTRRAVQVNRLTMSVVITFWSAYATLCQLTKPVTAASLRSSRVVSMRGLKIRGVLLIQDIVVCTAFLFMNNTIAADTTELLEQQKTAALKLWSNLQILRSSAMEQTTAASQTGTAFVNRALDDAVEFSRKNEELLQSAKMLHLWFNPFFTNIDIRPVTFDKDNQYGITRILISPSTSLPSSIQNEIENQLSVYQYIRNYASAVVRRDSIIYGGVTNYILPTIYTLLGAFMYGLRLYPKLMRTKTYLPSQDEGGTRIQIAAIAGFVIGLFGSLLPKNLALSPLAVAFLVGYAVEPFLSRLDDLVAKLKHDGSARQAPARED